MYELDGAVMRPLDDSELIEAGLSRLARNLYDLLCHMCSHTGEVMAGPSLYRWALNVRGEDEVMAAAAELEDEDMIEIVSRTYGTSANPNAKPHFTFRVVGYNRARREYLERVGSTA